jgi:hypothetical protein
LDEISYMQLKAVESGCIPTYALAVLPDFSHIKGDELLMARIGMDAEWAAAFA